MNAWNILMSLWPLILLLAAFFIGNYLERRHYADILRREKALKHIIVVAMKRPPPDLSNQQLVRGSVVVSSDYFRRFLAGFRSFFGGNVKSYETLLDRARREAVLRMKEQAQSLGANIVVNVKLETATLGNIHQPQKGGALGTVEVMAYGTAGYMPVQK